MTKISIIIPVYNNEFFIERCLESILSQTYNNLEVIVVNDGSKDKSLEIMHKISLTDNRVKIINQDNRGVALARNAGLQVASGEYIGFVDSDDYIERDMYEKLINTALRFKADIVECSYKKVDTNNIILKKGNFKFECTNNTYNILEKYLSRNNTSNYNWNKLYSKKILKNIYYQRFNYSEDYHYNVSVILNSEVKVTIADELYIQVIHEDSAVNTKFSNKKLDVIKSGEAVLNIIREHYPSLSKYVIYYMLDNIILLFSQVDKSNFNNQQEIKNVLQNKYNQLYDEYHKEFYSIEISTKNKKRLKLFRKTPKLYYIMLNFYSFFKR